MPAEKKDAKKKEEAGPTILTGIYVFPNGDKYEGEYIQNAGSLERCGVGIHTSVESSVYDGMWESDKMNGKGKLTHSSGASYEGDFVNNQFHGNGKYIFPNGSVYEGQFQENRLEGKGQFTDTQGQIWTGTFRYKAAPGLRFKLNLD